MVLIVNTSLGSVKAISDYVFFNFLRVFLLKNIFNI